MSTFSKLILAAGILIGASTFASEISDYYNVTCHLNSNSGQEMTRHQFLMLAQATAMKKRHCIAAFIKNGGYMYTANGTYLDDYTPASKMPHNCLSMDCY